MESLPIHVGHIANINLQSHKGTAMYITSCFPSGRDVKGSLLAPGIHPLSCVCIYQVLQLVAKKTLYICVVLDMHNIQFSDEFLDFPLQTDVDIHADAFGFGLIQL